MLHLSLLRVKKTVAAVAHDEDTDIGADEDSKDNSASPSDSRDGFEETHDYGGTKSRASRRLSMVVHDIPKSALSTPNEKADSAIK